MGYGEEIVKLEQKTDSLNSLFISLSKSIHEDLMIEYDKIIHKQDTLSGVIKETINYLPIESIYKRQLKNKLEGEPSKNPFDDIHVTQEIPDSWIIKEEQEPKPQRVRHFTNIEKKVEFFDNDNHDYFHELEKEEQGVVHRNVLDDSIALNKHLERKQKVVKKCKNCEGNDGSNCFGCLPEHTLWREKKEQETKRIRVKVIGPNPKEETPTCLTCNHLIDSGEIFLKIERDVPGGLQPGEYYERSIRCGDGGLMFNTGCWVEKGEEQEADPYLKDGDNYEKVVRENEAEPSMTDTQIWNHGLAEGKRTQRQLDIAEFIKEWKQFATWINMQRKEILNADPIIEEIEKYEKEWRAKLKQ